MMHQHSKRQPQPRWAGLSEAARAVLAEAARAIETVTARGTPRFLGQVTSGGSIPN
jgi:hypothetical protein